MSNAFSNPTLAPTALENLLSTLARAGRGDLSARMPAMGDGPARELADSINTFLQTQQRVGGELRRLREAVLRGDLHMRATLPDCPGDWHEPLHEANAIVALFAEQCAGVRRQAKALIDGELARDARPSDLPGDQAGGAFADVHECVRQAVAKLDGVRAVIEGFARNEFFDAERAEGLDRVLGEVSARLKREWIEASRSSLFEARRDADDLHSFADLALTRTAAATGAVVAALHVVQDGDRLSLVASLGTDPAPDRSSAVRLGEGLIGQAAKTGEARVVRGLDEHSVRLNTGIMQIVPRALLLYPVCYEGETLAIIEMAFLESSVDSAHELLQALNEDFADGILETIQGGVRHRPHDHHRQSAEDLTIAVARIDRLTRELQLRDRALREMQQELESLREEVQEESA